MARVRTSPPDPAPPRTTGASVPWMVFLSLIVCLAVAVGVQDGLGHPAGWLDQVAGRHDAVPTFAADAGAPDTDSRPVRIVPLAPDDPLVLSRVRASQAPPGTAHGNTEAPAGAEAPAVEASPVLPTSDPAAAEQTPAASNARASGQAPSTRTVTRGAPLRVYVAGDSSAEGLGYELQRLGARDGLITAVLDFKISSGLANPGYFNWPDRLKQAMSRQPSPEAVVIFLGGNDNLSMRTPEGTVQPSQPAWLTEYARRAGEMMDIAGKEGAQVYWVGMPVVRDSARNDSVAAINAALVEAANRPWVRYVDVTPLFGDVDGDYSAYRLDADGEPTKVRQDDGIHLTRTGSNWVAAIVYDLILQDVHASP